MRPVAANLVATASRNKLAAVAALFLLALALGAIAAPVVAPHDPYVMRPGAALTGPSWAHWL
ncbi:MAG TPA: hypothetical protein VK324_00865, partial [Tepidisphaeraceae bacterium]|nr:hypothetical protein [Tepidisphaeraceae bacterium]